jgi:large subunit ribosomal protein L23
MKPAYEVLKTIRLTEKSNLQSSTFGQYTFEVFPEATKQHIRSAVEATFKVAVKRVNIVNVKGKPKRGRDGRPTVRGDYKKAIVTLKQGDKIELS